MVASSDAAKLAQSRAYDEWQSILNKKARQRRGWDVEWNFW